MLLWWAICKITLPEHTDLIIIQSIVFQKQLFLNFNIHVTDVLWAPKWVHCLFLFVLFKRKCTCHIQNCVFLCSLDNFLLKNVIIFCFGNQISKWRSFEKKKAIFDLLFTFLVTREKTQKFLQHVSHLPQCSHTYTYFAQPINCFCLTNFAKITNLSCMVSVWCDSWCWFLFAPFWSNQWITIW